MRGLDHRAKTLDAFFDAAVDVALAERLARRTEDDDLVGPRRERRFEALQIGNQHRIAHAAHALQARHHLRVVGHLRHPLRADEAGDLDLAHAGGLQQMNELDLVRGRHRLLFILQTVAWTHIDQGNLRWNHDKSLALVWRAARRGDGTATLAISTYRNSSRTHALDANNRLRIATRRCRMRSTNSVAGNASRTATVICSARAG